MGLLSDFRGLPAAVLKLASTNIDLALGLQEVCDLLRQTGPSEARLEELERSRASWEAQMQAELQKADSTYKAAANAESRARTMERHAEKLTGPFAEDGFEVEDGVPPEHAEGGQTEGMHVLSVDVAPPDKKELAKRMKFLS